MVGVDMINHLNVFAKTLSDSMRKFSEVEKNTTLEILQDNIFVVVGNPLY
jgi:hypothetical protein